MYPYSFSDLSTCKVHTPQKIKNVTLQVQKRDEACRLHSRFYKVTSDFILGNEGGAVIEASIALPIFIMAFLALYSMTQIMLLEEYIYGATVETAKYISVNGSIYSEFSHQEEQSILNDAAVPTLAKITFNKFIDADELIDKYVIGKKDGIVFVGSNYDESSQCVELYTSYTVSLNVPFITLGKKAYSEHVSQKVYIGYKYDSEDEKYVYVAEHASVYHTSRECTHLRLSIYSINKSTLDSSKYSNLKRCRLCADEENYNVCVYVTKEGDCFHYSISCSGLKRSVSVVKLSEVGGLSKCSRCKD